MVRAPRMTAPLAISTGVHGAVLFALVLAGRFSWPAAPIPIEVVPRHVRPRASSGPSRSAPLPRPGESATPNPARVHHHSAASKAPPETEDLKPLAPDEANLVVLLRADRFRRSPHREAVEALLSALPDYHTLLDGSGLSLFDDFQTLLIATADPRDVTATFLAARFRDSPKVHALAGRSLGDGDPRVFRFLEPGLAVLVRPEDVKSLDGAKQLPPDDPRAHWLAQLEKLDQVGDDPGQPALLVTLADVPALLRFGTLPTPAALALAATAEASPSLRVKAVFADEAEATKMAAAWPEVLARYRTLTALVGLSSALDGMKLTRTGNQLELAGRIPEAQLRLALSWARALLPHPVDEPPPSR